MCFWRRGRERAKVDRSGIAEGGTLATTSNVQVKVVSEEYVRNGRQFPNVTSRWLITVILLAHYSGGTDYFLQKAGHRDASLYCKAITMTDIDITQLMAVTVHNSPFGNFKGLADIGFVAVRS